IRTDIGKVLKEGHLPVTKSGGKVYDQRTQALERMKSVHPENPLGIETVTKDILIDMGTELRTGTTTVVKPESRFVRLPGTSRYFENPFAMQTHVVRKGISDVVSGRRDLPIGFAVKSVKPEEAFWHTSEMETIRLKIKEGDNEWGFLQDPTTNEIVWQGEGTPRSVSIPRPLKWLKKDFRQIHTHPYSTAKKSYAPLPSPADLASAAYHHRGAGSVILSPETSAFIKFKESSVNLAELSGRSRDDFVLILGETMSELRGVKKPPDPEHIKIMDNAKELMKRGIAWETIVSVVGPMQKSSKPVARTPKVVETFEMRKADLELVSEMIGADIYYTRFSSATKVKEAPPQSKPTTVPLKKAKPAKLNLEIPEFRTGPAKPRQKQKPQAEPSYPQAGAPKKSMPKSYTIPLSEKIYNISQRSKSPEGSKEGYIPRSRFTAKFTYRPEYRPGKLTYKIDYKPPEYRPSEYKIDYKPPGYKPPVYKPPGYVFTSRIHPPPPPPPPPPPRLLWGGKDKKRTKKVRHSIFGALEMQHNIKQWDEVLFGTSKKPMKERTSPFLTVMTGNRQFTIPKTQLGATKKRLKKEKTRIEAIQF
ncbi:MAG: hypothetical protein PHE11_07790, partial [Candidatus Omnitrophica bacterium]|nr:hypothetical protein [Candidatus Omnitrophota bacterium]